MIHNEPGGWVRVQAGTGVPPDAETRPGGMPGTGNNAGDGSGAAVWLVVSAGGAVLDPGQVARLAEPFRRLGADRTGSQTGTGLGLAIVAAVADAHGGRLELAAPPTGGLRATVLLPGAPG